MEGESLKKRFNGVVIVTSKVKDAAEKLIPMEDLTFKEPKLHRHSLTQSEERREKFLEQKKVKIGAKKRKGKKAEEAAAATKKAQLDAFERRKQLAKHLAEREAIQKRKHNSKKNLHRKNQIKRRSIGRNRLKVLQSTKQARRFWRNPVPYLLPLPGI